MLVSARHVRWSALSSLVLLAFTGITVRAAPLAELIGVKTEDGVLLNGLHYRPAAPSHTVVIHIPGGPGAFYGMQDMNPMAAALMANGHHFLSMNTRTAGSGGFATMAHAKFEDYRYDVAAAVAYAKQQGLTEIVLLGHSLGSARVVYFLAQTREPSVRGIILSGAITSPYLEAQMRWNPGQRAAFDGFLAGLRERVRSGRGKELATYEWGPGRNVELSAASWLSIFGPPADSNASTVKFADSITSRVLLVHGDQDPTALPANAEQIYAALTKARSRELVWIQGGTHLFTGQEAAFAEAVVQWLKRVVPATSVGAAECPSSKFDATGPLRNGPCATLD